MEASGPTGNISSRDLPSASTADRTDSMADTLLSCRQLCLSVTMFCTCEHVPSTIGPVKRDNPRDITSWSFGRSFLLNTSCHQISGCTGFLSFTTSGSLGRRDNLSTSESYRSFSSSLKLTLTRTEQTFGLSLSSDLGNLVNLYYT